MVIFTQIVSLPSLLLKVVKATFVASLLLHAFACKDSTPPPAIPSFCEGGSETGGSGLTLVQEQLEYKKDVLPILQSTSDGKIYKCTVCHNPTYNRDDLDEKSALALLRVIKDGTMPTKKQGDDTVTRVTTEDISLIQKWYDQKFAKPSDEDTSSTDDVTGSNESEDTKIGKDSGTTSSSSSNSNFNSSDSTANKPKC